MIRIKKPDKAPQILTTKGKVKRRAMSAAYTRGKRDFEFDKKIYGHESVKESLITAQNKKCFLCESKITHTHYGDVEHFRPKGGYRQSEADDLITPGYYWLAYEWNNLFLSCQLCNQRFKKNLFPLVDATKRATSHKAKLDQEDALFINPAIDNPEVFISFRANIPYAIGGNERGNATIKGAGLDREDLNEQRLAHYKKLRHIYILATMNPAQPESAEALAYLENEVSNDESEYAAMVRAALRDKFSF